MHRTTYSLEGEREREERRRRSSGSLEEGRQVIPLTACASMDPPATGVTESEGESEQAIA